MPDLFRVGNHNPRNLCRVNLDGTETHVGCVFDEAFGPVVVAALNAPVSTDHWFVSEDAKGGIWYGRKPTPATVLLAECPSYEAAERVSEGLQALTRLCRCKAVLPKPVSTEDTDLREQIGIRLEAAYEGISSKVDERHENAVARVLSVVRPRIGAKDAEIADLKSLLRARDENLAVEAAGWKDITSALADQERQALAEVERLSGDLKMVRDYLAVLAKEHTAAPVSSAEPEQDEAVAPTCATHGLIPADLAECPWCPEPVYVWRKGAPEPGQPYPIMTTPNGSSWARSPNIPGQSYGHWIRRDRDDRVLLWSELVERALTEPAEPVQAQPRVWAWRSGSSYDPDPGGHVRVRDKHGDIWQPRGLGDGYRLWETPDTAPFSWGHVLRKWGPLTEVGEQAPAGQDGQP